MYAVLQCYTFDPAASGELDHHINEVWVPLLRQLPGFIAYYWLDGGAGRGIALCTFEDEASAQRVVALVSGGGAPLLAAFAGTSQALIGPVTAYANAGL